MQERFRKGAGLSTGEAKSLDSASQNDVEGVKPGHRLSFFAVSGTSSEFRTEVDSPYQRTFLFVSGRGRSHRNVGIHAKLNPCPKRGRPHVVQFLLAAHDID